MPPQQHNPDSIEFLKDKDRVLMPDKPNFSVACLGRNYRRKELRAYIQKQLEAYQQEVRKAKEAFEQVDISFIDEATKTFKQTVNTNDTQE